MTPKNKTSTSDYFNINEVLSSLKQKVAELTKQFDEIENELDSASEYELEILEKEKDRVYKLKADYELQLLEIAVKKIEFDNASNTEAKRRVLEALVGAFTVVSALSAIGAICVSVRANSLLSEANSIAFATSKFAEIESKYTHQEMSGTFSDLKTVCEPLIAKKDEDNLMRVNRLQSQIDQINSTIKTTFERAGSSLKSLDDHPKGN